jgi:VanZ family protein
MKKTSHALGYAILALCYLSGLSRTQNKGQYILAFILAVLYSASDEFHQRFVPGRHPSPIDVGIDSFGAALALIFTYLLRQRSLKL